MRKMVKKGIVCMIFTSIMVTSTLPVTKVNAEITQVQESESFMDWNLVDTFLEPNFKFLLDKKIPIEELEKQFPSEMEVILVDGEKKIIPVTWICESDYEKEDCDSYVFEVALPEEYRMSDTCASAFVFVVLNDDIKDGDETKNTFNNTSDMPWEFDGIVATPQQPQPLNTDGIQVEAKILGETEGFQYKFVWMKNNWKQWGVLQNFSSDSKVEWKPKEVGKYTLYVDIKNIDGKVITKSIPYEVSEIIWQYEKFDFFPTELQKLGEKIQIKVNTSGNTPKAIKSDNESSCTPYVLCSSVDLCLLANFPSKPSQIPDRISKNIGINLLPLIANTHPNNAMQVPVIVNRSQSL